MMLKRAEGVYVYEDKSKQYREGLAGLWCMALGYGNEELARTTNDQLKALSDAQLFVSKRHEVDIAIRDGLAFYSPPVIASRQVDELFDKFDRAMVAPLTWTCGQSLLVA